MTWRNLSLKRFPSLVHLASAMLGAAIALVSGPVADVDVVLLRGLSGAFLGFLLSACMPHSVILWHTAIAAGPAGHLHGSASEVERRRRVQRLWLCLPAIVLCAADGSLTLAGQPAE